MADHDDDVVVVAESFFVYSLLPALPSGSMLII